jgi:ABC-type uncharacterized transport system auxiliary subunit
MNRPLLKTALPAAVLSAVLLAQGCSGVLTSEQPAKQYYLLTPLAPPSATASAPKAPGLSLSITAIPGLDTDRILALDADARLNHYANARWPDHLPEVLTSVVQRSLESAGPFRAVRASDRAGEGEWPLQLEVREFFGLQGVDGSTSSVRVAFAGSVNCNGTEHALSLEEDTAVAEQRLAAVVAAHQAGLDRVTRLLINDISRLCAPGGGE